MQPFAGQVESGVSVLAAGNTDVTSTEELLTDVRVCLDPAGQPFCLYLG